MTPAQEFAELAAKATQGEVGVRPVEYDDWGWVRVIGSREIVAQAKGPYLTDEQLDAHRAAKTDPYGDNAAFIAWAFNHRALIQRALEADSAGFAAGIEAAAKVCEAERDLRTENANAIEAGSFEWGPYLRESRMAQLHKSVTAHQLAQSIRALRTDAGTAVVEEKK